jgi:hypothetical protein
MQTSGTQISNQGYRTWGETRFVADSIPTRYRCAGQYDRQSEFGLFYINAMRYDLFLCTFPAIPYSKAVRLEPYKPA